MPTFSVQCCQICPWQYGVKSLLGQQEDTLSIVQNANSFRAIVKRGPQGSRNTPVSRPLLESPFPYIATYQLSMEGIASFEEENTSF